MLKQKEELDFCTEEEKPAKQQKLEEASKKKELYSKRMHDMLAASVDNETEQDPSAPDDSAFGRWYHRLKSMSRADAKLFLPKSWTRHKGHSQLVEKCSFTGKVTFALAS